MFRRNSRRLVLEASYVVAVDDFGVRVRAPAGMVQECAWGMIEQVLLHKTDQGRFLANVFWEIQPLESAPITFPGGASGEVDFLEQAQKRLDGLSYDQVIKAMGSRLNSTFIVWERSTGCQRCGHDVPRLPTLSHAQRLEIRRAIDTSGAITAIKRLRELTGCDLRTAKMWVHHRGVAGGGHEPITPCPHCGQPLRSADAKQCRFCRRDWHDPAQVGFLV